MGEGGSVYRVLVRKPVGKRPLGRHRHRWEDNINMDRLEVGRGLDLIDLTHDWDSWRDFVNAVVNLRFP
jgi:hypothetical protein